MEKITEAATSLTEAQKKELILKTFGYRKIDRIGGSYGIVIPSLWVRANTYKLDGVAWARITLAGDSITITPLTKDQIDKTLEGTNVKEA